MGRRLRAAAAGLQRRLSPARRALRLPGAGGAAGRHAGRGAAAGGGWVAGVGHEGRGKAAVAVEVAVVRDWGIRIAAGKGGWRALVVMQHGFGAWMQCWWV